MGLDLDAIRKKLASMKSGRAKRLKIVDDKVFNLRIISFPDNDGQPFKERAIYEIGKEWNLLAPSQFDKPDPIKEFTDQLRSRDGKSEDQAKEDWELAKKLFAKVKTHAIVVDRDNEAQGPIIWTFTSAVSQRLYEILLNEDYGDITDVKAGYDLRVSRTTEKNGFKKYTIDPRPKVSPLHKDADKAKEWLDALPSVDGLYKEKSYKELEDILKKFVESGGDDEGAKGKKDDEDDEVQETTRGGSKKEEASSADFSNLDEAFDELERNDD